MARFYPVLSKPGIFFEVQPMKRNKKTFTLEELQAYVGGVIQMVWMPKSNKWLVIHEEGKVLEFPVNNGLTAIWIENYGYTDIIVGNGLLCEEGEIE